MKLKSIAILAPLCFLAACGGGGDGAGSTASNDLVLRESKVLEEGASFSMRLTPGTYKANVTSSSSGVVVTWVGDSQGCGKSGEVKVYSQICTFTITGQLLVANPTTFGLGAQEIVTVEVFKL
ncbi:hypothetical protein EYS42_05035 [Aquabacterium lacunae]|uniref:Lipoprotein n=1 Tax=Aquabacterium lacunae TaxID=2528630 RepID=A0A4V2JFT5_9BURK|nr:hypothetical protein [Aquabacterium lacunae]TBO32556.1 hypothetical protein EYS42_05035 [Aquabacterium lacunae]